MIGLHSTPMRWQSAKAVIAFGFCLLALALSTTAARTAPNRWYGTYLFEETGPRTGGGDGPAMTMAHRLRIYPAGKSIQADLQVDGYQTSMRMLCTAKPEGTNRLRLYLREYRKDNGQKPYAKGAHLFSLVLKGKPPLETHWVAMRPLLLDEKQRPSFEGFQKAP
ncbi:MAG: hypothetical protein H7Z41_11000 [Cytophagales bacterium]|nr:hypothetical protein [Armatimonadota bacterium]